MASVLTHRNLPLLLLQAREAVLSHFRPIINHFGLTEQQWRIIRTLSESDAMEPRQIAEVCRILGPSLTGVLARMDELGLVERRRLDADQRRILVSLTGKSRELVKRMAPLVEAQYWELERAVGHAAIAEAYRAIDLLLAQLNTPVALVELPRAASRAAVRRPRTRKPRRG